MIADEPVPASRPQRYRTIMAEAPTSERELFARAEGMAGRSLAELAASVGISVPPDLKRHKGWVGNLMERVLGATAASRDEPDFEAIGVELKTIPVDMQGRPRETTFVATIPLAQVGEVSWERSRVRRKLARVLWIPVLGLREVALGERRVGAPLLWSPSEEQEAALRFDWEELAGMIGRGDIERVTGRFGRYLQVRPKAAHGGVRRRSIDTEGHMIETLPRGFYLRTQFTAQILRDNFALPG
jgi:DNA mismatch repair protein MutH